MATRPAERLGRLEQVLARLGTGALDLLVCPELFLPDYAAAERLAALAETAQGPFAQSVGELARRSRTAIVFGYPERADGALYNAVQCRASDGALLANHRKLFLPTPCEQRWFTQGSTPTRFELLGHHIGLLVCYDIEFPEPIRHLALAGCDLVVVPTALGAGWTVVARKLIPAHTFENNVFLLYANYAGVEGEFHWLGESVVGGPDGHDLARAGASECLITASIDATRIPPLRQRLPQLRDIRPAGLRLPWTA